MLQLTAVRGGGDEVLDLRAATRGTVIDLRVPDSLVGKARLVVLVVVGAAEVDDAENDQHDHRQDDRELDQRLASRGTQAESGVDAQIHPPPGGARVPLVIFTVQPHFP